MEYEGVLTDPKTGKVLEVAIRERPASPAVVPVVAAPEPTPMPAPAGEPPMAAEPMGEAPPMGDAPEIAAPESMDTKSMSESPPMGDAPEIEAPMGGEIPAAEPMADAMIVEPPAPDALAVPAGSGLSERYSAMRDRLLDLRAPAGEKVRAVGRRAKERASQIPELAAIAGSRYADGKPVPIPIVAAAKPKTPNPRLAELNDKYARIKAVLGRPSTTATKLPPAPRKRPPRLPSPQGGPPKIKILQR